MGDVHLNLGFIVPECGGEVVVQGRGRRET